MSFLPFLQSKINYYKSIDDMPIYNFHQYMVTQDLKWLLEETEKYKSTEKTDQLLVDQWVILHDEYLKHFGISKNYKKVMEQEDKITKLMISRWLKDDASLETIIKIETMKLDELNGKKKKGSSFEEDIAVIEKYRGIGLDPKKTSVKMFYTYINLMQKDGEKN
jgi:hypothetical protein